MCVFCRILNKALVHLSDSLLHQRVVADAVLSHLDIVGCVPDEKVRGVGEENRRHRGKAMTHGEEVNVILTAGGEHAPDHRMRSVGDIALAVVENQKTVLEVVTDLLDIVKLIGDDTACAFVGADPVRKPRMHQRDIEPFILVRGDYQSAAATLQILTEYLFEHGRLAGAWGTDKNGLVHRPKLWSRNSFTVRLRWNRRCWFSQDLCWLLYFAHFLTL